MANTRWIVTDMDDTMIKHYGKPSDKVRDFWNQLAKDRKNFLVVATGQSHIKVMDKFLENNLALPDYIIANQGTVIYSPKANEVKTIFYLTYTKTLPIIKSFLRIGGEEKFIRVCTLGKVIVLDCKESRSFYEENPQSNIEFVPDIWEVLRRGKYTKLVLSAPLEIVERMLLYPLKGEEITLLNSGETGYGRENYYRFEIVASNKRQALEYLLLDWKNEKKPTEGINILGLGDEITDYGLAEVALLINLLPHSTGYFAVIHSASKGNALLTNKVQQKARTIDCEERLIFVPGVEFDGWVSAVLKWREKIKGPGR